MKETKDIPSGEQKREQGDEECPTDQNNDENKEIAKLLQILIKIDQRQKKRALENQSS